MTQLQSGVPVYQTILRKLISGGVGEVCDTWTDLPASPVSPPPLYCGLASDYS